MGLVETLRAVVAAAEALWPYLLIPGLLGIFAKLGQFTDLSRREIRGWRAGAFGLLLATIQMMDLRWLDRDMVAAVGEGGVFFRSAAQLVVALAFLYVHRTNTTRLLGDKVKLDHRGTILLWTFTGYVSIVGITLLANFPLLAIWMPSLAKWPQADVWKWTRFDGRIGLILLAIHGGMAFGCASERGLRWFAGRFAATNLIASHLLVFFTLVVVAYLRSFANEWRLPVFTLGAIVVVFAGALLSRVTGAGRHPGREVPTVDWSDEGAPCPDRSPLFFAAEGGGIHAAYRSAVVLAELDAQTGGRFWQELDATSSISGGSVGTAAYTALREQGGGLDKIRRQATIVGRSDMLLPGILRTVFTEPWMLLFPRARGLDRSKGLEAAISQAVESAKPDLQARQKAMANGSPVDWQLKDLRTDPASGPRHFFNTASVKSGERYVVATACIDSARTSLDEAPGISRRSMPLRSAAALSARFPLVSSSGMVRLSPDGSKDEPLFERLIDGGLYDNLGVDVLLKYIRDLQQRKPGLKPLVVLVSNNYEAVRSSPALPDALTAADARFGRSRPLEGLLSVLYFGLGSLTNRNDDATRELIRMADEGKVTVVSFLWSLSAVDAPLGWFLDGARARLISYMLGCEETYAVGKSGCFFVDGLKPVALEGMDIKTMLAGPGLNPDNVAAIEKIRAHNKASLATLRESVASGEELARRTTRESLTRV